ncbi:LysR family transcriptional regulator [Paraburkholderia fynbosensis]|uniref:HTH-type transcriptional regulator DmlR n=1 Tax=Paraburkholderia fynbosensis TaxID=1200993 RepID=A0A6J5GW77_9BURK|nr:LysR family transcriptional regulator [Paraburkholderia fynbosensis]CAB3807391.1 HTH-type transcriptional regulator DmlR [Paraburkholderia fynbosensis]
MDNFAGLVAFVKSAETCSFVDAGRILGISASAVGKSVSRLEERLATRLFQRNTRNMKLTAEGVLFLQRCQRIISEMAAAEEELSDIKGVPRGLLRVSLPYVGTLLHSVLDQFMIAFPNIELEVDFSDRKVDLIDEAFDAVVRIGDVDDSRLVSRQILTFQRLLVASPDYLVREGSPEIPTDLLRHRCLLYKFPNTGKIEPWPVDGWNNLILQNVRSTISCNAIETLAFLATQGRGIACLPDFCVRDALERGQLQRVLDAEEQQPRPLTVLWPSSKYVVPKLRAFIDFLSAHSFNAYVRGNALPGNTRL